MDTIEKLDHSLIQHGPANNRVYLMKVAGEDVPGIIFKIDVLAKREGYTKIFAKVPRRTGPLFAEVGYVEEAAIPGFYNGDTDAVFLGKYLDPQRQVDPKQAEIDAVLALAAEKGASAPAAAADDGILLREAAPDDAEAMAVVFREVFESYPFPIHDPAYLRETMESHIRYFLAVEDGRLIAVSSAEMDKDAQNVEMTDFATLPACRGKSLAVRLLSTMEDAMQADGMKTFYTIARSLSAGMNITFARCGYRCGGTLINNTNICGKIESMNVWHKRASSN